MTHEALRATTRHPHDDRITVLICDDHPTYRDGLKAGLGRERDLRVVGEARNGNEAVTLASRLAPRVVLMDLKMEPVGGVEATRRIRAESPDTKVLILTANSAHADVLLAVEAGAAGYEVKAASNRDIAAAVRKVDADRFHLSDEAAAPLFTTIQRPASAPLTQEEVAVVKLIAEGKGNKEIDRLLNLGTDGAKHKLESITEKFGTAGDRTSAAVEAMRRGYID